MPDVTIKIFLGTDANGKRLKDAIKKVAKENYFGNMSRTLIWEFCKRYGYDPKTGHPVKREENGAKH